MSSLSSEEETEKIADQSGIELLPIDQNGNDEPAIKPDVGSYHSDGSLSSLGLGDDDIDAGGRAGGVKGKKRPRTELIQVCIYL